jgi:peptidoglycan/xylan/chitin deacetylase (PgdA/CDA1 family)
MSRARLPILTYHAIDTSVSVISTDPAWFAETMRLLHAAEWHTVDLADWIASGRPALERTFALTFDDGLRSILTVTDILARYRYRATAFLVTDRMGCDNAWPGQPSNIPRVPLVAWGDLGDLQAAGFRFGSHTRSHVNLNSCDHSSLLSELRFSAEVIESHLGQPCSLLAYPYGAAGNRVRRATSDRYKAAFGTRFDVASSTEDVYRISRIDAYYLKSYCGVRRLISSDWRPWLGARRAARRVRSVGKALIGSQC